MASKRRLRRRACGTKRKFATQALASDEIRRRIRVTKGEMGGRLAPYHCEFCGQYHIGHPPAAVRQSMADRRANQTHRLG